ncbi:TraX family protein [uncultured Flavonifractor sp.]|uniref:TraX family protein n=1 Tax=uncultured Flavonifractor sp. TaxID=1193534 RepID=UPI00262E9E6E|nr:TraX family protein [uncultured Flavonifractor sp.]
MECRYGLSAAALKYLAALCMLVDHMGMVFPTMLSDLGLPLWADLLPRLIGRLAFPIFAYFVAEGCRRTRFFSRYLLRLGLFALLSQLPFALASGTRGGNVILTFFLAAGSVWGFQRAGQAGWSPAAASLPLLAACVLALALNCDYGFPGVLLVFALWLQGEDRKRLLVVLGAGLALIYLVYQPLVGLLTLPWLSASLAGGYLASVMPFWGLCWLCASASLALLGAYRGQLGVQSKWFFYVFYPAHLLGLWTLSVVLK